MSDEQALAIGSAEIGGRDLDPVRARDGINRAVGTRTNREGSKERIRVSVIDLERRIALTGYHDVAGAVGFVIDRHALKVGRDTVAADRIHRGVSLVCARV